MKFITYRSLTGLALVAGLAIAGCGAETESDLLASAKMYLEKKDNKAALVQLKTALQTNPQSGEVRYLLGDTLYRTGDMVGAIVELEKALELKQGEDKVLPPLAKALLATGQAKKVSERYASAALADPAAAAELKADVAAAFFSQGMNVEGEAAVKAALQLDPRSVNARQLQVRVTAGHGAFDEALALMDQVIADDSKRPEAWQLKGELLSLGKSDPDAGVKAFRAALAIDERYLPAHLSLIRLMLQRHDAAGFKAQVAALRKALPNRPEPLYFETQQALSDHDLQRASDGVQQLVRMAPEGPLVRQLAGAVEFQKGALQVAEDHLNRALKLSPDLPAARRLLAQTHLRSGQPLKALATLQPLLGQPGPSADVLMLAAEAHLQIGDVAKSESLFKLAASANPDDPKARAALALMQVARGNGEAGFAQLESLASTDITTSTDLALISARLQRNDLDAALRAIDRLQGKLANKPLPHLLRGRVLLQRNDLVGARASFDKALATDAAYYPAVVNLAAIDVAEQKPDAALKRFQEVLARETKNFHALLSVAGLRQRMGAKPEEVAALLTDAVQSNPGEALPRLALVEHYLLQRQAKAALAAAQEAFAAMPNDFRLLDALGRAQMATGDTQQAIASFRKVAVAQPSLAEPQLRLANAYVLAKDLASAKVSLRRALEIAPNFLEAQRGLVQLALAEKRADEALQVARALQKQRPREPVGYLIEGEIQAGLKAWEPAVSAFRSALERNRSSEMATRLHGLFVVAGRAVDADAFAAKWLRERPDDDGFMAHLGALALERKDYAAAEARYRQVLAVHSDDISALNNVSWLMVQQGKPGALALAERANKLAPDRPEILDTLASALAADKQAKNAIKWQKLAVEKAPEVPGLRLNLAKLYILAGERTEARVELEKLTALGAKFAGHAEVSALLKAL